jgi:hypothetical protein
MKELPASEGRLAPERRDKIDLDYIIQILKGAFDEKNGGFGKARNSQAPTRSTFSFRCMQEQG